MTMRKLALWGAIVGVVGCAAAGGAYALRTLEKETLTRDEAVRLAGADGARGAIVASSVGWTHYEVAGPDTGRVVVLVHGFSVPFYIWDSTFTALAGAGYRVIRYDLLGRGLSERADVSYRPEVYQAQLGELLDSLKVPGKVDLVGLSFGGFVTAFFAAEHAARVRSLVLVDPVVTTTVPTRMLRTPVVGRYLFEVFAAPGAAEGQPGDFLYPERFPGWADRYRVQQRYRGFARSLHRTRIEMGHLDLAEVHGRIARQGTPVLLVWGRQDTVVPIAQADTLRAHIPSTEFVPVDSAGHLPHLEQAPVVTAALLAFFAKHP